MRILHIQGAAQLAGCERSCELFIQELPRIKHAVAVLGGDGAATKVWEKAGAEIRLVSTGSSRLNEYMAIARTVKELVPDAAILWSPSRLGLKVAACRNAGIRRIAVHVGNPIRMSFRNAIAAEVYTVLPGGRRATLIPVSRHVERSYLAKSGFRHFPSRLVYNAIDTRRFQFQPYESFPKAACIGMIARLDRIKDHATLLRAWRMVLRTRPGWRLEFAGDGPLRPALEALAKSLGIADQVGFLGWASDVANIMRTWSLIVHSTTRDEGLGNSMLEAMAMGRPLVATAVGPVSEITDNGRVARMSRVADPGDLACQILDVEADWSRTHDQVAAARQRIDQMFSPTIMVTEYLRCLGLEGPA